MKRIWRSILWLCTLAPPACALLLWAMRLEPIYFQIIWAGAAVFLGALLAWGIVIAMKKTKHTFLKFVPVALALLLAIAAMFPLELTRMFYGTPVAFESSPSGKHRLVIVDQGFLDAAYHAYPVRFRMFYQLQDNGFVSFHEGTVDGFEVEWEGDERAIVRFESEARIRNAFSNPDDRIVVEFR